MKDNIPIKRHPAIASFSKDHHFGLLLAWKIRQGIENYISPERISNYVIYSFDNDLKKHFSEEEELLFSKLPARNRLRQKAEADHKSILLILSEIKKDKSDTTLLNKIANEVEINIRFEERELFSYLQTSIPEKELEGIISRTPDNGRQIDDQWKDVFWEIKK
ncbi:MAG: hemerythrin domain-containing protein [Bacteroidetes bacterium]|nr:hemerythrin domain-containing protein [Bacteroidota bacterium]